MTQIKKYCCTLLLFIFASISLWAQKVQEDVVYLQNGSIIRGKILEFEPKGKLKVEIAGGTILVYEADDIVRIEKQDLQQAKISETIKDSETFISHRPPNKGMYNSIMGGTLLKLDINKLPIPGVSLKYTAGYNFHHFIGIGGGLGIMSLEGHAVLPIYANIRSYFLKTSASPFVDMNVGYGFILPSSGDPLNPIGANVGINGGLYLRPSIGVRFPSNRRTHVTLDFGYVIQFKQNSYLDWNGNQAIEQQMLNSISLRIGITL